MKNQLQLVAESYDRGIELGRKGIDSYDNFPSYYYEPPQLSFVSTNADERFRQQSERDCWYLAPKIDMKFIDLGCCVNLMYSGYKDWPSTQYGVDISSKTIELLREFMEKNHLTVGDLYCGSMHKTPYETDFFDIGECVGSLEYFERDFVRQAVEEFHRIIKPNGRFVLDIPNVGSPEAEIAKLIEEYLGRPDKFNLSAEEFETILDTYFVIDKKEIVGPMIEYFLVCKK